MKINFKKPAVTPCYTSGSKMDISSSLSVGSCSFCYKF